MISVYWVKCTNHSFHFHIAILKLSKFAVWTWLWLPVLLYGTLNSYWFFLLIYTNLGDHWGWWKSVCQPIHIDTNNWWLLKVATQSQGWRSFWLVVWHDVWYPDLHGIYSMVIHDTNIAQTHLDCYQFYSHFLIQLGFAKFDTLWSIHVGTDQSQFSDDNVTNEVHTRLS